MSFSEQKEEQLKQMPVVRTKVSKSKDGKYVMHTTEITSIKPVSYYEAVLSSEQGESEKLEEASA